MVRAGEYALALIRQHGPQHVSQADDSEEVLAIDHWQVANVARKEEIDTGGDRVGDGHVLHVLERSHDRAHLFEKREYTGARKAM